MGDPEVRDLRAPVPVEQDVLRLDVAVDEPLVVREREPARDLQPQLDRLTRAQRPSLRHQLLQVHPVHVFEDDELAPILLAPVDHRDDVRVSQLRDGARLAAEALDVVVVPRELLVQDLQRDRPFEQAVVRAVDARHAARADELLELITARDQFPDHEPQRSRVRLLSYRLSVASRASSQTAKASSSSASVRTSGVSTRMQFE